MKLTLQEKVERDFPLNKSELSRATGQSRIALQRQRIPYVGGKITLSEYKRHREKLVNESAEAAKATQFPTKAAALPWTVAGLSADDNGNRLAARRLARV